MRPKTICRYPGCGRAQEASYCTEHEKKARAHYPTRPSEHANLYNYGWTKIRRVFLMQHPICKRCEDKGRLTPATVVDHIVPHKGDTALFYDPANFQPLCASCHAIKTNKEDGGFGNPIRAGGAKK
jgi:5-methylcytosine-specific restriction protein A